MLLAAWGPLAPREAAAQSGPLAPREAAAQSGPPATPGLPPLERPPQAELPPVPDAWAPSAPGEIPPGTLLDDPRPGRPRRFFQLPEERFRAPAEPLVRESWLYRPYYVGGFIGMVQGSTLVDDWVKQDLGPFGGFRLGWDVDPYIGGETRFGWGGVEIFDTPRARAAARLDELGYPWARRTSDVFFWDLDLLYYPWGDARWRPFLSAGIGLANVEFDDIFGRAWGDCFFSVPLGVGVKCRWNDFLAMRLDLTDNMVFGGGHSIEFQNNISLTGGVEFRFGGARRKYWPWNPGK